MRDNMSPEPFLLSLIFLRYESYSPEILVGCPNTSTTMILFGVLRHLVEFT